MKSEWKFFPVFLVALPGMLFAAVAWNFGYQFAINWIFSTGSPRLMNPPTMQDLLSDATFGSLVFSVAGLVPLAIFAISLHGEHFRDRRKIFRNAIASNGACVVAVVLFFSMGMMPIWLSLPVSAVLALFGAGSMTFCVVSYARLADRQRGGQS